MKKKLLIALMAITAAVSGAFGFAACGDSSGDSGNNGNNAEQGGSGNKHTHDYGAEWKTDEDYHWHECKNDGCDAKIKDKAVHKDNDDDGECDTCNYVVAVYAPVDENVEYTLSEDGNSYICSGLSNKTATDIVIASEYKGKPVTSIGKAAFEGCSSLTSVVISNGVSTIETEAFFGCTKLQSITIPPSLNSIGRAFDMCDVLTEIKYTGKIEDWCKISGLKYLMSYQNEDAGPYSSRKIYINNQELKGDIVIPDGVSSICDFAFENCYGLTSVKIPESVTSIGEGAFNNCYSLIIYCVSESKPDGCESDGPIVLNCNKNEVAEDGYIYTLNDVLMFALKDGEAKVTGCFNDNKTEINIPETVQYKGEIYSVTAIGYINFYNCSDVTGITIPDSVTYIGYNAFYSCKQLIQSEGGVKYVDNWIVGFSSSKKSVTLKDDARGIADGAFTYNLNSIIVSENSQNYSSQDGILYNKSKTEIIFVSRTISGSITIASGVTAIGDEMFRFRDKLEGIVIPEGVTSIGENAFSGCSKLTNITIPASLTFIGKDAFNREENTSSETKYNGDIASWCGISGVNYLNLKGVYFGEQKLRDMTEINIPDGVTSICDCAFVACSNLITVTIPDSVTSIGTKAFYNCSNLKSIVIPDSVTTIGRDAFYNCNKLIMYCEAEEKPSGWDISVNYTSYRVVWGYKGEEETDSQ